MIKRNLRQIADEEGFNHFGIAECTTLDKEEQEIYENFIAEGRNAGMEYMKKYPQIRNNPALLIPETTARSIIATAVSYYYPTPQPVLRWARYALGKDYHIVIRKHLQSLADYIESLGFKARICVDTAPLRERLWAVRAGIGTIGRNNLLLTDSGSYVLLGFIVTDAPLPADKPLEKKHCTGCGACLRACPGNALKNTGNGTSMDANLCNSYLTIEHRGALPDNLNIKNRIYGCDVCQEICPANIKPAKSKWEEFKPSEQILGLTSEQISSLTPEQYSSIFRDTSIKRAKLSGLKRNADYIRNKHPNCE